MIGYIQWIKNRVDVKILNKWYLLFDYYHIISKKKSFWRIDMSSICLSYYNIDQWLKNKQKIMIENNHFVCSK
jgi:hypothetical protein